MNFDKLYSNIISVVKEAQIKLGYEPISFGINYIKKSLCHLLNECGEDEIEQLLNQFCSEYSSTLGDIEIAKTDAGYRLVIPPKGTKYVNDMLDENEFLVKLINAVKDFSCNIDRVVEIFNKYGDDVHFERTENGEFDYLIYFESGKPDSFWYCLDDDDFGITYHRFTKEDYIDFNF